MKFLILLVCLSISFFKNIPTAIPTANASDLILNFSTSPKNMSMVLAPIWNEVDYQINWDKKELGKVGDIVQAQLIKASVSLGQKGTELFQAKTKDKDTLQLDWKLNQLKLKALIKIRFKFRQYGLKVTHDEYFEVSGENIRNAKSTLQVFYQPIQLKLNNIQHQNFALNTFKVKPKDGIGSVLRFIFDNIFSEKKVNAFIKSKINQELENWINQNDIIANFEKSLNQQLVAIHNTPWTPNNSSWKIFTHIDELKFMESMIRFRSSFDFDTTNSRVHICSNAMLPENQLDDITFSYSFIENVINSFATYEHYDNNGKLEEPLFCLGYKDYDEAGAPLGEEAKINFLNRNIHFNYWVKPSSPPVYTYNSENNHLSLDINLLIKIKGRGYPKLLAINDQINTSIKVTYQLEFLENIGLQMRFVELDINKLEGKLKIKWLPYTPWLPLSINRIKNELEKSLNTDLNKKPIIHLLDQNLIIDETITIQLKDFDLKNEGINFSLSL